MIRSFADAVTQTIFLGGQPASKDLRKLGGLNLSKASERLAILDAADERRLLLTPALHYHKLKGSRRYSIDADSRKSPWRITFQWENEEMRDVQLVKIEDTHEWRVDKSDFRENRGWSVPLQTVVGASCSGRLLKSPRDAPITDWSGTLQPRIEPNYAPFKTPTENMKTTSILRDSLQVPLPASNPAAGLIRDTLAHHRVTQVEAARAMGISPAQLSDVIRQRKGVSATLALRFQACFGVPGDFLVQLQSQHDYREAYHSKNAAILREVRPLQPA